MSEFDKEDELRYREQINYRAELLNEIRDINKAIKMGNDGSIEMMTLMSDLIDEIRQPIDKDLNSINEQLQKDTESIRNMPIPLGWSEAHKQQYIELECKHLNVVANLRIKNLILNQMNSINLLMNKSTIPMQGYMSLYKEDDESEEAEA